MNGQGFRGKPPPVFEISTDETGRNDFVWIHDEEEYRKNVEERLKEIRATEAVNNAQRLADKWEEEQISKDLKSRSENVFDIYMYIDTCKYVWMHTCMLLCIDAIILCMYRVIRKP